MSKERSCTTHACLLLYLIYNPFEGTWTLLHILDTTICDTIVRSYDFHSFVDTLLHSIIRQLQGLACELIRVRDDNHRDEGPH